MSIGLSDEPNHLTGALASNEVIEGNGGSSWPSQGSGRLHCRPRPMLSRMANSTGWFRAANMTGNPAWVILRREHSITDGVSSICRSTVARKVRTWSGPVK